MKNKKRCSWPMGNDLMVKYHDEEWGTPVRGDRKLFEFFLLDTFQAGLSWQTILNKRQNFKKAYDNFDFNKIAKYTRKDFNRLMKDAGIIRNRLKIEASIINAKKVLEVRQEFGTFDKYIWQFTGGKTKINKWKTLKQIPATSKESDEMSYDLKKRGFKFVGSTTMYAFMQGAGMVNDHTVNCFRHNKVK